MLGEFVETRCVIGAKEEVLSGVLYKAYKDWAGENNYNALAQRAFTMRMQERPERIGLRKGTSGQRLLTGVALRPNAVVES